MWITEDGAVEERRKSERAGKTRGKGDTRKKGSYPQKHKILCITQKFFTRYCLNPLTMGRLGGIMKPYPQKSGRGIKAGAAQSGGKGEKRDVSSNQERRSDRGI